MRLVDLVETSDAVGRASGRLDKIALLAERLGSASSADEAEIAVAMLCGEPRQGRLGLGWAAVRDARSTPPAPSPSLTLIEVDAALLELVACRGRGSAARRRELLATLWGRATAAEQDFLGRLVFGELRQGALEGVVAEALARAANLEADAVRRAAAMRGQLAAVAAVALTEGERGLARFGLQLGRPIQPMLAQTAADVDDALGRLGTAALEHKLDGARVQVHRDGDDVRVFSRQGNDVTAAVPEIVESVLALPVRRLALDGEAIALGPDGRPAPFQVTMRRFGRRLDVERMRLELPLSSFFFDCLHVDGEDLLDRPFADRIRALDDAVPAAMRIPRIVTASPSEAAEFVARALAGGQEGVMAKALDAAYGVGRRGGAWLKIKPAHTLDLVVLAAEWGSGRRRGSLSNLHLGARDPAGGFVMLGKTFKGMTDEMLRWQTERLLALESERDEWCVRVRPELVVEVAFDGVQRSSQYPGGVALRFARVRRYRLDKTAAQADTIETVQALCPVS